MLKIVDNYTLDALIGQGAYGKVYKATNHDTHQQVAIKAIYLEKFIESSKLISLTRQQIKLISCLESNANVIKFVEVIKSNRYLYMVYEYCEGGTLQEFLRTKPKNRLSEKQALALFRQLINAMKGLSENNIIHRDIKPDNIFLKNGQLKLADFGFCKQLQSENDLTQTSLGSPLYMAPEVLNGDIYSMKADVWSCGIVLYQMLFGFNPFGTCNIKELISQHKQMGLINMEVKGVQISSTLKVMLSRMLNRDQFKRISWEEFFYEYSFDDHDGQIRHKQKDFEYDLMKLMKKNQSGGEFASTRKNSSCESKIVKFDWEKLISENDTFSSVHSQECDQQIRGPSPQSSFSLSMSQKQEQSSEEQTFINEVYKLKKKINEFENEHSKVLELSEIIEQMLSTSPQSHQYDTRILYFLIHNLCYLLQKNCQAIDIYLGEKSSFMETNKLLEEKQKISKIDRIFKTEIQHIKPKLNSIKGVLLTIEETETMQIFRYPQKASILKQTLTDFLENYEVECEGILDMKSEDGNKEDGVRLLKILWGLNLIRQKSSLEVEPAKKQQLLRIQQSISKREVSALINSYLVELGV